MSYKIDRINELEQILISSVGDCLRKDLDWTDLFDVLEYVLGKDVDAITELKTLVNEVYGV